MLHYTIWFLHCQSIKAKTFVRFTRIIAVYKSLSALNEGAFLIIYVAV